MAKFCKNCGAYLNETSAFCPDCGRPNHQNVKRQCHNCGCEVLQNENFCRNCGAKIKEPQKESFLEKYKTPIIVIVVLVVMAIITVGALIMIGPVGSQDVQVDTFSFSIPEGYELNEDLSINESDGKDRLVSRFWQNSDDFIQIDVSYSTGGNVDQNKVARDLGGNKTSMMGYDGYYEEISDAYSFTFVKDNKLITVYTSTADLLDEIELL